MELVDTPGLCNTHKGDAVILREVVKIVAGAYAAPHLLVLVPTADWRFTKKLRKLGYFHTTAGFKRLAGYQKTWCELKVCHGKMTARLRFGLLYMNSLQLAELADWFEQKITKGCEMKTACKGGGTAIDECLRTSAKNEGTKKPDPPNIGLETAFINIGDTVLQTVVDFCGKGKKLSWCSAAKAFWIIIYLMNIGCSASPLPSTTCSAGTCAIGEPTSVTCQFARDISASRQGVILQMIPFNSTNNIPGKDALVCSWQKNAPTCFVEDGYSFNNIISDRLTLEIPAATPEVAGMYMCLVASEVSSPLACNLTVTERRESSPTPITTDETSTKATSNSAQPSWTIGQVLTFTLGLCGLAAVSALLQLCIYKRIKAKLLKKYTSEEILPKDELTSFSEQNNGEEKESLCDFTSL